MCPDIIHQYKLHYYAALSIVEFSACRVHSDVCVCGDEIVCGGLECHCYNTSSCVLADHSWSGLSGPDTDADATHSQGPPGQDLCNALGERLQVELFFCRQCSYLLRAEQDIILCIRRFFVVFWLILFLFILCGIPINCQNMQEKNDLCSVVLMVVCRGQESQKREANNQLSKAYFLLLMIWIVRIFKIFLLCVNDCCCEQTGILLMLISCNITTPSLCILAYTHSSLSAPVT